MRQRIGSNTDENGVDIAIRDWGPQRIVKRHGNLYAVPRRGMVKCLVPGCEEKDDQRGLCMGHYQLARRLVKQGETTWRQLEIDGKCRVSRVRAHPDKSWFLNTATLRLEQKEN